MKGPARKARARRGRSRGALLTLAGFLVISGAIRLGTGMSEALTGDPALTEAASAPAPAVDEGWGTYPDPGPLLEELRAREARLAARERALEERVRALDLTEERVRAQIAELIVAEERLAETLALADRAAERDLERLTQVYESMKPKDAAALFAEMDTQFAAGFIARMTPESGAAILAGLPTHTAYSISVILAGRHVGVPTQ